MRSENKRRILAGVIAAQLVLQGAAMNMAAYAEDATEATTETAAQTTAPTENAETETTEPTETTEAADTAKLTEVAVDTAMTAATDTISMANPTQIPAELKQGKLVNIKGVLTSAESELTAVSVIIYDQAMVRVTGGAAQPKSKTYDLSRLDDYVTFDKLVPGAYVYRVIASNAANSNQIVQEVQFKVVADGTGTTTTTTPVNDVLTVSGVTEVPENFKKGSTLNVKGTVTSASSDITYLTCGVYNSEGKFVTGKTIAPKVKSYDLQRLDAYVAFDKLEEGTYIFAVIATNAANNNYALVNKTFKVTADGAATTTTPTTQTPATEDKITGTGITQIPDTLKKGTPVSVRGTVTSAVSNITRITVSVTDAEGGGWMTGKTVDVNTKSYNIANLDQYVLFNKLPDGVYNYNVLVTNAANDQYAVYTKKFTVGNPTTTTTTPTGEDKLTISGGTTVPDTLAVGKALNVVGTVTSANTNMTALTVGVYNMDGKFVTGKTINPKAKTYNLKNLDAYVEFNKLAAGEYVYAVIASNDANTNYALVNKKFTVGNSTGTGTVTTTEDKLTISGGTTVPDNLAVGKALSIRGTVTSASSNITKLTCGVFDTAGNLKTGKEVTPNAKTYNLHDLDAYVEFNKLPAGSYVYAVYATNSANAKYAVVNKSFTVGNGGNTTNNTSNTSDALNISGGTTVPDSIAVGKCVSIRGTVTSASSAMTALTCGVYDANGKFVTGKTINPNAKSYDLHKLDAYVAFNVLPAGSYTYAVIATNAANSNYALVNKKFTVGNSGSAATTTNDAITISGGTTVPSTVNKGKGVIVRGTVSSASSNLTTVTVGVYNANGTMVTGKSASPNAKTYNVSVLDSAVRFDQLAAGTYTYRVIATNGANSSYTVVNQTFTVK